MKNTEIREEIKKAVIEKGINNITNADITAAMEKTGADTIQAQNAINYFRFSPQAAKYRG